MSNERAEQEATEWFARMRGPDADQFREAFEAWRTVLAHAEIYENRRRAWDTVKFITNTGTGRQRDLARAKPWTSRLPIWTIAAAVGFTLLAGAAVVVSVKQSATVSVGAPRTEVAALDEAPRRIILPDGSAVILDRGAKMEVAFNHSERRIHLVAGRGRFTVAHDVEHPFIVDAGDASVVAHGTMFDVELGSGRVGVALLQGAVEVRSQADSSNGQPRVDLTAGQGVELVRGNISPPSPIGKFEREWPNDMLELDGVSLAAAVETFNRTSRVRVTLGPDVDREMKVSGAFRRSDPDAFAYQLAETFALVVDPSADGSLTLAMPRKYPAASPIQ